MTQIIIDKRFCGPPNSGNGGYVCGRLARHIPGAAEITLRAPPPLDTPLDAVATDDGTWELRDGNKIVATGQPASVELSRLETASFEDACAAELLTPVKPHEHPLPTCFVCGPARAKGDGLRILPARSVVTTPFSRRAGRRIRISPPTTASSRRNSSGRRSTAPPVLPAIAIHRAAASTRHRCCWGECQHGSKPARARENAASSRPGPSAATAANARPKLRFTMKPGDCWRWRERHGLRSSAKCSSDVLRKVAEGAQRHAQHFRLGT